MSDNLPALPQLRTSQELVNPVTDSWAEMLPQVAELARAICTTQFVPEALRNNVAGTTAAILYNREIGLPPMTGLNAVHVIKGKVGISAEMMRAKVLEAGHELWFEETNTSYCIISGRRKGSDRVTTVKYSETDAKTAGLFTNDNYKKNPRRMYQARATSELCALVFADVIRGMVSSEELEAEAEAGDSIAVPAEGGTTVQRKTRARKASPAALEAAAEVPLPGESQTDDGAVSPPADPTGVVTPTAAERATSKAAPSSPPLPPLPGEPGFDDTDTPALAGEIATSTTTPTDKDSGPLRGTGPEDAPGPGDGSAVSDRRVSGRSVEDPPGQALPMEGDLPDPVEEEDRPRMITRAEQRGMFATFNTLGIVDDAERLHITQAIVGRTPMHKGVPSSNGLTEAEFKLLVDALARCKTRDHVEALVQMAEEQRAEAYGHRTGDDS